MGRPYMKPQADVLQLDTRQISLAATYKQLKLTYWFESDQALQKRVEVSERADGLITVLDKVLDG